MLRQNSFSASPKTTHFWALDAVEDAQDSQNAWMTKELNNVSSAPSPRTIDWTPPTYSGVFDTSLYRTNELPEAPAPLIVQGDEQTDPFSHAALNTFESSLSSSSSEFGDFQDAPFEPTDSTSSTDSPLIPIEPPEPSFYTGLGFVQAAYARFDKATRALRKTGKSRMGRQSALKEKKVDWGVNEWDLLGVLLNEVEEAEMEKGEWSEVHWVVTLVNFGKVEVWDEIVEKPGAWGM
jgi:hypothetical protein